MHKHQARHVVYAIYRIFEPHIHKRKKPRILAAEALLQIEASHPTIIKARRALGVESVKIAGRFYWAYPRRTPQEALKHSGLQRVKEKYYLYLCSQCKKSFESTTSRDQATLSLKKPACPHCGSKKSELVKVSAQKVYTFRLLMSNDLHYDAPAKQVLQYMQFNGAIRRREAFVCKGLLGIKSYLHIDGSWHWIYMAEEVEEWLDNLVTQAEPARFTDIMALAAEKGWSELLIRKTLWKMRMPKRSFNGGVEYWHDVINS